MNESTALKSPQRSLVEIPVSPEFSLDQCIKCTICTTACPVAAVTDLFPGPKYEGPQAARFRMKGQDSPDRSVDYCSGCRICDMVCPNGVQIAEMNARGRAAWVAGGNLRLQRRLRNNLLARPELLGKLAHPVAPLANRLLNLKPARQFAEFSLAIHHSALFPPLAANHLLPGSTIDLILCALLKKLSTSTVVQPNIMSLVWVGLQYRYLNSTGLR